MECWSVGVLECWSVGVLECWSVGVLECWSVGRARLPIEQHDRTKRYGVSRSAMCRAATSAELGPERGHNQGPARRAIGHCKR